MSTSAVPEQRPDISLVIPVYACASFIDPLLERTRDVVRQEGLRAEWVFVDDASPDDAWRILKELSSRDERIRGLRLARNCGQHFAIYAGLKKAKGRFTIVMDGDLEDPPEEIPRLLARAKERADIVVATYSDRAHPDWRRVGSRLYFWMLGAGAPDGKRLSMFTALSERGRSAYLAAPLAGRAYLLVLLRLDLPMAFVSSYKEPRPGGGSSYSFGKLSPLAARNLLLFNPRRFAFVLATLAAIILLAAVTLWGAWPAVPIWLACSLAVGSSLAAWRLRMIQGWASRRECETEMLHG